MDIFVKPLYIPLVQKPFCCNVTCLAMILYRRGYGLFDQEMLAKFFDVRVNPESRSAFNVRLGVYARAEDAGNRTVESAARVNSFFHKQKIALVATAVYASDIKNVKDFVTKHLKANDDLWIEYKIDAIRGVSSIHDNVVESIQTKDGVTRVVLVDPEGELQTRIAVPVAAINEAISNKFGRETGFLVIQGMKK